jgi:alpha-amylase/alpha-mannosidase (GH57 family)
MEPPMPRSNFFALLFILFFWCVSAQAGDLYLNIIWHQHQPLYVDPQTDQLRGPWVRTHATKDYYDMAAMHEDFPEIHATINLTSSLLFQLQNYYVDRLSPYLYHHNDGKWAIHSKEFLEKWEGKTDPWIDLALKPSMGFAEADRAKLTSDSWNAFGISDIQIARFPQYLALRNKPHDQYTKMDYAAIKTWFFLAHFDPDFLRGTSKLDVNLSDLVKEREGKFFLIRPLGERDANRLVADAVRVMQAIVPEHKTLMYDPESHTGQLEIITTPFYHPILSLLIDSDIARVCQPHDSLPPRFSYPQDAEAQVIKSEDYYTATFGKAPQGMWPAEGSISPAAANVFAATGLKWFAGDMHVLQKSLPANLPVAEPYRIATPKGDVAVVFRETTLSDHIGFTYQHMDPDSAAAHFISEVLKYRPAATDPDRLLTVILDGENAWEWYEKDMDGKHFLKKLYSNLSEARGRGEVTCVTPTEYFQGNPTRKVPAHPITSLTAIENLWPGSWINANYDTWIGEPEENRAWSYLLETRKMLSDNRIPQPDAHGMKPTDAKAAAAWDAYESMYAAEGSDWFWWFGADQTAPGGDLPFEQGFLSHLRSVYRNAKLAGADVEIPDFKPILDTTKIAAQSGGVMNVGSKTYPVRFVCDASAQTVSAAIYIAGNLPELGAWVPNTILMYDDGTHSDFKAGDGIWTLELSIPLGTEVQYKYTNSGAPGAWQPSEEFSRTNRAFTVNPTDKGVLIRADVFGKYE